MRRIGRGIATGLGVLGTVLTLVLLVAGPASAGTVSGHSCGEDHPMAPDYYDAFGNPAPCTADFSSPTAGTARITIQITQDPGASRREPHRWSFDVSDCSGTVLPGEPPRTFTCPYGPGAHTVYVDKGMGDKLVALTVDY